jgi:hypothetical protein
MGFGRVGVPGKKSDQAAPDAHPARAAHSLTHRTMRVLLLWVACFVPAAAGAQVNWEYSPYSVKVWVAFGHSAESTDRLMEQIAETVSQRAYVVAGATWDVETVRCPAELRSAVATNVESITIDDVKAVGESVLKKDDKLFLLGVQAEMTCFVIKIRELDCRSRVWRPVLSRRLVQPERIPREAFAALADAFSPLVRIEIPKGRTAQVRIRAGGLITSDSSPSQIHDHDVLMPIIRRNDRVGEPMEGGIQVVPWTFMTIAEREGAVLQCNVHSFTGRPLGGRSSSRTVKLALVVKPRGQTTFLKLETRDESRLPLGGYEIRAKAPGTETETSVVVGMTDWRGMLEVPKAEKPLRILYVRNGGQLLARLPMVPGLEAESAAQVRNDDLRLQAEGFVKGLQSKVMELVARRHLYEARFKRHLDRNEVDEASALLKKFRTLETRSDLLRELRDEEQRTRSPDKRVQAKIDQLFKDTSQLLSKFLDPDTVRDLTAKLEKAQGSGN